MMIIRARSWQNLFLLFSPPLFPLLFLSHSLFFPFFFFPSLPLFLAFILSLSPSFSLSFLSLSPSISHTSMNETATNPQQEPCSGTIDTTFPSLLCMLGTGQSYPKMDFGGFREVVHFLSLYSVLYSVQYRNVLLYSTLRFNHQNIGIRTGIQ